MKAAGLLAATLVSAFALAACATSSSLLTGQTTAGKTLQGDVIRVLLASTKGMKNCGKIDSIAVAQLRINPPGTGDSVASRQYGSAEERWTVSACGTSTPYLVTLTPDGQGGTFFRIVEER